VPTPPNWEKGKCFQQYSDLFFPEPGRATREQRNLAKQVCNGSRVTAPAQPCPIRAACRDYAIAIKEPEGIWGGLSIRERRKYSAAVEEAWAENERRTRASRRRQKREDAAVPASQPTEQPHRRTRRADAPAAGGGRRGTKAPGHPPRERVEPQRLLPTGSLLPDQRCSTSRTRQGELSEIAGHLRGGPRRPRQVAALDQTPWRAVRPVEVSGLRPHLSRDVPD
jgi:WhiB family redox-sensing transcriptional regulator